MGEQTGSATGKLLLFGEHAAVYGHPALGISLPWRLELKVTRLSGTGLDETGRGGDAHPPLPEQLAAMFGTPRLHGLVEVRSQIPVGLGFGSSAALCVAAERALAGSVQPLTAAAAWRGAHERERVFHGTPSGADTGLAAVAGTGYLTWESGGGLPRHEPVPAAELHLVVAAVPRRGDTRAHVAAVAQRMRAGDTATRGRAAPPRSVQHGGEGALACTGAGRERPGRGGRPSAVDARRAWPGRSRARAAAARGPRRGPAGGKLSGAGGGGACFLVCRDARTAARVLAAVRPQAAVAAHVVLAAGSTLQQAPDPRSWAVGRWLHVPRTAGHAG